MRIVVFISNISRNSGGMSSAWDLAESLNRVGFEVSVIVKRKDLKYYYSKPAITSFPHPKIFLTTSEINGRQKNKPNRTGIVAKSFETLFRNRKRCHKSLERADLIIDAVSLNSTQLNWIRQQNTRVRIIRNHAGSPTKFKDHWLGNLIDLKEKEPWARYYEYCSRYDGLLFQSQQQEQEFWANLKVDLKIKTQTIRPSCEEEKISKVVELKRKVFNSDFFNVAIIGSIQYVKGTDLAIEALNLIKEDTSKFKFHFVGSYYPDHEEHGKYFQDIKNLVKDHQLEERAVLYGHRSDYLDYMCDADLILQPSREEGVSRILREAMYMRKPIMAFHISGTGDLLKDRVSADLIEPYNVTHLAERLLEYTLSNQEERGYKIEMAYQSYLAQNSTRVYLNTIKKTMPEFLN